MLLGKKIKAPCVAACFSWSSGPMALFGNSGFRLFPSRWVPGTGSGSALAHLASG